MNDMRQTLLWSVLVFSVVMLWEGWLRETGQPTLFSPAVSQAPANPSSTGTGTTAASSVPVPGAGGGAGSGAASAAVPLPATGTASAPPASYALVEVSTDTVKATVDTLGGSVVKLALLKHTQQDDHRQWITVLDRSASHTEVAQSGLVSSAGALPDHTTPMTVLTPERQLAAGQNALVLTLESAPVGGVKRLLSYTFPRGGYVIDVKQTIVNTSAVAVRPQLYVQLQRDGTIPATSGFFGAPTAYTGAAFYTEQAKFQKVAYEEIESGKAAFTKAANDGWVSTVQHYFAAAWLHNTAGPREFFARKVDTNLYAVGMMLPVGEVAPGQTASVASQLFVGPQEEKKLEAIAPGLELVKDYGIVTILAKPLYWLLHAIHTHVVPNWGWAIVLLVVLLKVAFYWLNAKAYASMAKMKAINPKIQEMRERLKDKPQEMQQEMLKIYREEKVNPVGGCLPILIQMPIFIALYWVLLSSVEIRNAPWIGWITDLSVKDPFYVLPALMTASTMLQTWLNPTPPDPMQAKMMWMMPLVFSVMFFFFPAGLVLYWVTNNVLSIAQQWLINRRLGVA
jgi:YidC/Oxa1 family membrane protein insertase